MKLFLLLSIITFNLLASDIPSGVELQKMLNDMRSAYGLIDEKDPKKNSYDINKKVSDKELKKQVDEMERVLKTNPKLNNIYK